jgi:hypothetical protein
MAKHETGRHKGDETAENLPPVERIEITEVVFEEDRGSTVGSNVGFTRQRKGRQDVVAGLNRLYQSLRGPELMLDQLGYDRPFPTTPPRVTTSSGLAQDQQTDEPFGSE